MNESEQPCLAISRVAIAGEMTIFTARDWRDRLLAAMEAPGDVELDLGMVSEVDAAGIQLLVSLALEAREMGRALRLVAVAERITEAFEFCRLTDFFREALPAQA